MQQKYNHDNEIHQKEKVVNVNNSLSMSNNGASEKLEAKQTIGGTKKLIGKELYKAMILNLNYKNIQIVVIVRQMVKLL